MDLPVDEALIRKDTDAESSIRTNERQRISRELHNTTSQLTTALQLHMGQLRRLNLLTATPIIAEIDHVIQEIRLSINQIATQQSQDGHNCGEPNEAIAKRFYALGHREAPNPVIHPVGAPEGGMGDAARFRGRAKQCHELARAARHEEDRRSLQVMGDELEAEADLLDVEEAAATKIVIEPKPEGLVLTGAP